jgi:hypothetical protein
MTDIDQAHLDLIYIKQYLSLNIILEKSMGGPTYISIGPVQSADNYWLSYAADYETVKLTLLDAFLKAI